MSSFDVSVRTEHDRAVMVLAGELDFGVQDRARDALESLGEIPTLVVDLSRLTFMDTSGIHLLLEARDRFRTLIVVPGPAGVQRALAALHLDREFEFAAA